MKLLVQRVTSASVTIDSDIFSQIGYGLLVFVGIEKGDDLLFDQAIHRLLQLRIFEDEQAKMNLDIEAVQGELLLVSQFTLCADLSRGNRPSFASNLPFKEAMCLFDSFYGTCVKAYEKTKKGKFGAEMSVQLVNQGPATFFIAL